MGSLRINNAPTLGDLACRLARRRARDAITGQTIVQAYNRLKDFANGDGVKSLLSDVDEIYSNELERIGLPVEKISTKIKSVENLPLNGHSPTDLELAEWQEFEFALVSNDPGIRTAKESINVLNLEQLNIHNTPILRSLFHLDPMAERLGFSKDEKEKLSLYLQKREELIRENSCPITKRNRIVLSRDIYYIGRIPDFVPVNIVINGLNDPEEVQDALEATYCDIDCGTIDFIRIESNLQGDEISISAYSKLFVASAEN